MFEVTLVHATGLDEVIATFTVREFAELFIEALRPTLPVDMDLELTED